MGKIGIIARREFNERVKKKSFIFTTVLIPVAFVALMGAAVYMSTMKSDEIRNIVVTDESGMVAQKLTDTDVLHFEATGKSNDELRAEERGDRFGILHIGANIMTDDKDIDFYTYEPSTMSIEGGITSQINKIIEDEKLKTYDIDNLAQIMADVETDVSLHTMEITEDTGESRDSSSALNMGAAYIFGILIYFVVFLYGMMVMQGVIEEKSNKVLEIMVSAVKPYQLMMGKIIGIASVAITQLVIWVVFIGVIGSLVSSMFAGDMVESAAAMQAGMPGGVDMAGSDNMLQALTSKFVDFKLLGGFVLYFIGGYLLYAAMFAAVGSAVDNEKDTQNLQLPITLPLILGFFVTINVMNDPHTSLAFWFSIIPFTSPIVMMARLAYGGVPMWELALSIALLYATFVGMAWFAGKIYRVGIFMYGKKPTFKELYKWAKYKS